MDSPAEGENFSIFRNEMFVLYVVFLFVWIFCSSSTITGQLVSKCFSCYIVDCLIRTERRGCVSVYIRTDRYLYGPNVVSVPLRRGLQWSAGRSISSMCFKSTTTDSNY